MPPEDERPQRTPQGEALAVWALWGLVLLAILVTYSRLAPEETYNVSRGGIVGGLSRIVVELNFPIALVAIAITLVALSTLPTSAWWAGGPAIALCAVTAVPGVVDQHDLDARWVNAVPAAGVAIALGLTTVAARRAGRGVAPPLSLDRARIVLAAVILVISIPWIAAILGFYLPEGIFIMERPAIEDGVTIAAVHLGQHHGFMGALIVVSALLLSRPRVPPGPPRLGDPALRLARLRLRRREHDAGRLERAALETGHGRLEDPGGARAPARADLARDARARGARGARAPSGEPDVDSAP